MSRERLEWTLALLDRASGPARKVAKGLDAVGVAQERLRRGAGRGGALESIGRGINSQRGAGRELESLARAQRAVASGGRDVGAMVGGAFATVGAAALSAAAAVGRITLALGESMVQAADWRNRTEGAFRVLLRGDQSLGGVEGAFQRASQYANRFGLDVRDVARQMTQLTAAGFSQREIPIFMQAAGDLGALEGPQAAERAITAIRQIRSKGVTQMEEIRGQLSDAGFNVGDFVAEIGRARGLRGDAAAVSRQVEALMTARRIDSNEGSQAFLRVMQARSGGRLGATLDTQSRGAGAAMNRLRNNWLLLQSNFARSPAFARIIGFIERMAGAMDPASASAQRFSAQLGRFFDTITGAASRVDPVALFNSAVSAIGSIGNALQRAYPYGRAWVTGVYGPMAATLGVVVPALRRFFGAIMGGGGPSIETVRSVATALGVLGSFGVAALGAVIGAAGALARVLAVPLAALAAFWTRFMQEFQGVPLTFRGIGLAIVNGIFEGISSAWGALAGQLRSLAGMLPQAVRDRLGIRSPSRVFAQLGGHVASGFALGIERGTGDVLGAVGAMVATPDVSAVGGRAAALARASGGVSIGSFEMSIQLVAPDGADGEALGVAIASVVRRELEAPQRRVGG